MDLQTRKDKQLNVLGIDRKTLTPNEKKALDFICIWSIDKGYMGFEFVSAKVTQWRMIILEIKLKEWEEIEEFKKDYKVRLVLDVTSHEETLRRTFEKLNRWQYELWETSDDLLDSMRNTVGSYHAENERLGENSFEWTLCEMKDAKTMVLKFWIEFEDLKNIVELKENGYLQRMALILE